jgi:MOSC domain-containing protein YiiM
VRERTYDATTVGSLASVNVSGPVVVRHHGREISTGIFKRPVEGRRRIEGVGVAGDAQADRRVHGGTWKAIYAYAAEDYTWWSREEDRTLAPGTFGENLTVVNIDIGRAHVGDRWRIGSAVLEVGEPRLPCFKLGIAMGDMDFPERFRAGGRPGTYLRILEEGEVGAGDAIEVEPVDGPSLTIAEFAMAFHDGAGIDRLASTRLVSPPWREWAQRRLARGG